MIRAIAFAVVGWSPVTIATLMPACMHARVQQLHFRFRFHLLHSFSFSFSFHLLLASVQFYFQRTVSLVFMISLSGFISYETRKRNHKN